MITTLIILFFVISFFTVLWKKRDFIYLVPIFNVIADIAFNFFKGFSIPTYLRAIVLTFFLFYSYPLFKKIRLKLPFHLFFIYIIILLFKSKEFIYSFKASYQVILSMSMFLSAYIVINNYYKLEKLLRYSSWIIVIAVIATAVGYIFGIGKELEYTETNLYSGEAESVGLLGSGGLYAPAIILAILPFIRNIKLRPNTKWLIFSFSFVLYIFILLNVRRTAIIIPILGFVIFFIYSKKHFLIMKYILIAALGFIVTFPIYSDYLLPRLNVRIEQGRFDSDFYQTEARYIENTEIIEKIKANDNPAKNWFGNGNNIFAEHIKNGKIVRRMYHSDSAKLFYGVGIIGIFLYILVYLYILKEIISISKFGIFREIKAASLTLFMISIFVSINGSITLITFRSVTFLLLGAFIGCANNMDTDGRILLNKTRQ